MIRPESFCGVVGYKASQGRLSLGGVKPLALALDSLGCFARSAVDMAPWFSVLGDEPHLSPRAGLARIARVRTKHWDQAAPETRATVEAASAAMRTTCGSVSWIVPAAPVASSTSRMSERTIVE